MKRKLLGFFVFLFLLSFGLGVSEAAVVSGKISFEGQAPAAETLTMDADPSCQLAHPDGVQADDVLVNANGTLKNVFIYVKQGLEGQTFPASKEAVMFDQKDCQYSPKVFGIQVGQPLEIMNSDNTLHNVHSLSEKSAQFNLGMPLQGMKLKKSFTAPEVMVKIKCDVHPWMAAYAGVLDHPFYAVSGDDGSFAIQDLPAGSYVMEAWHEKYGVQEQAVSVTDEGATQEISFSYKA